MDEAQHRREQPGPCGKEDAKPEFTSPVNDSALVTVKLPVLCKSNRDTTRTSR
jgi:hypothetical protein